MDTILEVKELEKIYPAFRLDKVSFALEEGKITGFIGRNGAGKTTTLHSLLGLLRPDGGEIRYWGGELHAQEQAIKQRVGFVSAGMEYYKRKKLKAITAVTRSFYDNWDEALYQRLMRDFGLDENKTPEKLSNGMKIKYLLVSALSHGADLLILDEPTSGLDPVSREELLELFLELRDRGKTILFSTHITSDLDKTADNILYIAGGKILAEARIEDFTAAYRLAELGAGALEPALEEKLIGPRRSKTGRTALLRTEDAASFPAECREANLEEIMVHLEKEAETC